MAIATEKLFLASILIYTMVSIHSRLLMSCYKLQSYLDLINYRKSKLSYTSLNLPKDLILSL